MLLQKRPATVTRSPGANIFRRVKAPKVKDADTRALSLEEAGAFFDAARGSKFEAFFHVAALTGARRGELVGLKWDAVDLDAGALTVRTSLASTRAKKAERAAGAAAVVLKGTKSGKSRQVPLDRDAVAVLRRCEGYPSRRGTCGQARRVLRSGLRFFGQARAAVQARCADEGLSRGRRRGRAASGGIAALAASLVRIVVDRERRRYCGGAALPWALRAEHDAEPILARRSGRPGESRRRSQRYPSASPGDSRARWEMTPAPSAASLHRLHRNCTAGGNAKGLFGENPHENLARRGGRAVECGGLEMFAASLYKSSQVSVRHAKPTINPYRGLSHLIR